MNGACQAEGSMDKGRMEGREGPVCRVSNLIWTAPRGQKQVEEDEEGNASRDQIPEVE